MNSMYILPALSYIVVVPHCDIAGEEDVGKKDKKTKKKNKGKEEEGPRALDLRKVAIPGRPRPMKPAEIRALREGLNASQALFARLLNVSSNAVESWEQGVRQPRQATLKLLYIVRSNPGALLN
jgi:DNA-binding transcriptional regulator YiaG